MIWLNKYHRGFNRFWMVLSLFPALWLGAIDGTWTGIKTFAVCLSVEHIGFIAVWWIVQGLRFSLDFRDCL